MVGLITNENALIAQSVLRAANAEVSDVQQTISTGLLVSEASDNPAFFLVAQTTTGDQVVVDAIADNLEIAFQAAATAEAAIDNVFDSLDRITDSITLADSGIALQELNFAISQEVNFIRNVIENTSFNGLNLLSGSQTFTTLSGVVREGGEIRFQSFQLRGLNLDDLTLFGENGAIGQTAALGPGSTGRERAQNQGEILIRSFRPETLETLDLNSDGFFEVAPDSPDDAVQGDGLFTINVDRDTFEALPFLPVNPLGQATFSAFTVVPPNLPSAPLAARLAFADSGFLSRADANGNGALDPGDDLDTSPATFTFGANLDDFQFFSSFNRDDIGFNGSSVTLPASFLEATIIAPVDNQTGASQTVDEVIQNAVLSSGQLREFASGSGFSGLLNLLDVSNPLASTAGALVVVDALREKANLAASQLGTISQAIANQQEFLSALSDSLSIGVAALVEADLDEESGRVQAALVRQALAVQGLAVANAQPGSLLQLFEAA